MITYYDRHAYDAAKLDAAERRIIEAGGMTSASADDLRYYLIGEGCIMLTSDGEEIAMEDGLLRCGPIYVRGAYNYTDLNRVGAAVQELRDVMDTCGYHAAVIPKTDWTVEDIQTPEELATYLANIAALRAVLPLPPDTPAVPDSISNNITQGDANAIEQILDCVASRLDDLKKSWVYACEIQAGEG